MLISLKTTDRQMYQDDQDNSISGTSLNFQD